MAVSQQQWNDATKEAKRRIEKDSFYQPVIMMASLVSNGALYLAGGKLYRTLAEVLYGGDYGSVKADWDFVSLDTSQIDPKNPFWNTTRGPSISPTSPKYNTSGSSAKIGQNLQLNRSWRMEYNGSLKCSVDVVAIEDILPGGIISDYLDSVPLSIQALALQIKHPTQSHLNGNLIGVRAENALRDKVVHWNNQSKLKPLPAQSPDLYFTNKLASLPGFMDGRNPPSMVQTIAKAINQAYKPVFGPASNATPVMSKPQPYGGGYKKYEWKTEQAPKLTQSCSCSSFDLFSKGCKCGAVTPYDANDVMNRKYS